MWGASDQEPLGLESTLLLERQQHWTRSSHDSLFQRHHHAQLSDSQDNGCTRTLASQENSNLQHALLLQAAPGPTADLSNMQLDLDNITLATALGLGGENVLAQFHRSLSDQAGQSSPKLSAVLATSHAVLPGQEGLANLPGRSSGLSNSNHDASQSCLLSNKDRQSIPELHKSPSTTSQMRSELGDIAESDNQSGGDEGSAGAKRKGPMSEEDKKRRRQEINRQSARRIRERRSHEMERLKQQNAALQQSQTLLLKYASTLAREKNVLIQRTLDLTQRWNQAAAENLELQERLKVRLISNQPHPGAGSIITDATPAQRL